LRALAEVERRQTELRSVNRELEDTNRGVVALFAELDEKAEHLRRADELKSRFLSNMSHEFRTPVHSIQALTRMLLDRTDGPLNDEQERQVGFIRKAADALAELVTDLLDLARVEAGKTVVRPSEFDVEHLFGALRGMLRPLLVGEGVALVFEEPAGLPALFTDEAKVSQILRNFISNALKFTESGEVRVWARPGPEPGTVELAVADTGIGIAPEDQERIFQEFTQIDHPLQRKVQGTGLGLPLCRKLAEVLGGRVSVESRPGVGSTFRAVLPIVYDETLTGLPDWTLDPTREPLLVVEDRPEQAIVYERLLADSRYQPLIARSVREAHSALAAFVPRAVILDILLRGEDAWGLLAELKRRPDTKDVPIAVISDVRDEPKALALGADAYCPKPIERNGLLRTLTQLLEPESVRRVLIVDDEEISRYVLRQYLSAPRFVLFEASTGLAALRMARARLPDAICLDLGLEDVDGVEVLRQLRADTATRRIPVLVVTAQVLSDARRAELEALGAVVISKDGLTREATLEALERALAGGAEERPPR
jgi:signal transduction histidine kinase/CheY-like chemotaxis protein